MDIALPYEPPTLAQKLIDLSPFIIGLAFGIALIIIGAHLILRSRRMPPPP
jgi:hypothetical protein